MTRTRPLLPLALVVLTACVVSACGGSSSDDETTAATGAGTIATGGTCTKASITKAVDAAGKANGTTATLSAGGFKCAEGWATADVDMGDGEDSIDVTLVFKREGDKWVSADRETACKAPGDQVPEAIFELACGSN